MYEINCLDLDGNTIQNFTQWDVDQKIVVSLKGCDQNYLDIAPQVHYCNNKSKEALVVRSVVSNRDTITADVPNILLQQPYPLLVYIYLTDSEDVSSQKTILYSEIPIRKRLKPSNYLYVENIERITAEMIKEEIEADVKNFKDETISHINEKRNEVIAQMDASEKYITDVKDDAYQFITNAKDDAVKEITDLKNDTINYISGQRLEFEQTGRDIVAQAQKIKDDTNKIYQDTVDISANTANKIEEYIDGVKTETVNYIDSQKAEFEQVGNGIIADAQKIKDDTLGVYTDTVDVAGKTAAKIEEEIRKMMLENGMSLKITDDGNGICDMSIIVNKKA